MATKNHGLAALSYLLGPITGIVVYLVAERNDKFSRFHALQSTFFSLIVILITAVVGILTGASSRVWDMNDMGMMWAAPGWMAVALFWAVYGIGLFIYWLYLMLSAYAGKEYKIPFIGKIAKDTVK